MAGDISPRLTPVAEVARVWSILDIILFGLSYALQKRVEYRFGQLPDICTYLWFVEHRALRERKDGGVQTAAAVA